MKYMILMLGDQATMMEVKTPEWIREMIAFMGEVNDDLVKAGELVDGQGLADASQAKTVRFQDGATVATDGPYAEAKESPRRLLARRRRERGARARDRFTGRCLHPRAARGASGR